MAVGDLCENGFQLPNGKPDMAKKGGWSLETPREFNDVGDRDLQCFFRMIKICYALKVRYPTQFVLLILILIACSA